MESYIEKTSVLVSIAIYYNIFASVKDEEASQELLDSKIPIVDIRTSAEWKESGLLKGIYCYYAL